jgi:viologen exporter family transport system permease protein
MAAERAAGALRRLLALWRLYGSMDLLWMARDLRTVLAFTLSDLIFSVGSVAGMLLLAIRFGHVGRWSTDQLAFMLGYAQLVTGLPNVFFNYNVSFISRRLGRGQLDHTLVQPLPLWMALLTEGFSPFSAAMQPAAGLALLAWTLPRAGVVVSPGWLGLLALNLAASMVVTLAFTYIIGSLAFWAPRGAEEINSQSWSLVAALMPLPLDGAGAFLTAGLLTLLPTGLIAWYPCRTLLRLDTGGLDVLVTPAAAVCCTIIALLVFTQGLRHYVRTGSQRYLSFGHRR